MKKIYVMAAAFGCLAASMAQAGAVLEDPNGSAWAGVTPFQVTYDSAAPTGNFGDPDTTSSTVPYNIYVRDDGTYYYVDLQTTGAGSGTSFPDAANLYFDTDPQNKNGADVGFEISQTSKKVSGVITYTDKASYFIPLVSGKATQNDATSIVTDSFSDVGGVYTIDIAIPNSFFTSGPLAGPAYPSGYPVATDQVGLDLSQTFGTSVVGLNGGIKALGSASVVPLPASTWSGLALLGGLAAFGGVKRLRKQMA